MTRFVKQFYKPSIHLHAPCPAPPLHTMGEASYISERQKTDDDVSV